LTAIQQTVAREQESRLNLLAPGMGRLLLLGISLAVLQQITGINVFLYFGPEIFKGLGSRVDAALLQQGVVGAFLLGFTVVAIWTVDWLGRKPLMIIGAAGMGLALLIMGLRPILQISNTWSLAAILIYTACFSLSVGPVTWVILSEIFPNRIRGRALSVATFCLWTANFIVSQTFPMMDENPWLIRYFQHGFPFFLYGIFCFVLVAVVWRFVPETKGRSLEEIERSWEGF
jgi:SP family xylose:H+ symportor-like MFS transporter